MNISPVITRGLHTALNQAKHFSPQILTGAGIIGVVAAGVMAARATLKLEEELDYAQSRTIQAKEAVATGDQPARHITTTYFRNAVELVKLYGPSVTLGAASIVCIVSAHGILHKRNATLAVAYKTLETAYSNYRERVIEEYGEEVDRDFRLGLRNQEVVDEKGKKTTVKVADTSGKYGDYVFIFGPENPNWEGTHEFNEFFLDGHERYLNDLLRLRGNLFLNEVLDRLGFARTEAGAVTGWVVDKDGKSDVGDNYVSFRQYPLNNAHAKNAEWPEADMNSILLDFNVQGYIVDRLKG